MVVVSRCIVQPLSVKKNSRPRAAFPNIVADMARVGPALT